MAVRDCAGCRLRLGGRCRGPFGFAQGRLFDSAWTSLREVHAPLRMTTLGWLYCVRGLGHNRARRCYGLDSEGESIDLADDDAFSGGNGDGGDGVPQLAVPEDFSSGREHGLGDSDFAD